LYPQRAFLLFEIYIIEPKQISPLARHALTLLLFLQYFYQI
jgi:hypothetical protein